jgi:hypothetical protein
MLASKHHHGGAEQQTQVIGLIFFSRPLCLCADYLFRYVIKNPDFHG